MAFLYWSRSSVSPLDHTVATCHSVCFWVPLQLRSCLGSCWEFQEYKTQGQDFSAGASTAEGFQRPNPLAAQPRSFREGQTRKASPAPHLSWVPSREPGTPSRHGDRTGCSRRPGNHGSCPATGPPDAAAGRAGRSAAGPGRGEERGAGAGREPFQLQEPREGRSGRRGWPSAPRYWGLRCGASWGHTPWGRLDHVPWLL